MVMKKGLLPKESYTILSEYEKKRLILYADTLLEIAGSFHKEMPDMKEPEGIRMYLLKTKKEQNHLLADQLAETANTLKALANETYQTSNYLKRLRKKIEKGIKENGLIAEELYVVEIEEHLELGMKVKAKTKEMFYTDELMEYLSELCHRNLRQNEANPTYVHEEARFLIFEEELNFFVLDGVARAKKENEEDSGDSYLMKEFVRGSYLIAISDGMGSGNRAAKESERLLDMLDKFMETGFHVDKAGALLNSLVCLGGKEEHTITLDTCELDLYQGTCRFVKYGAGASFIKRGNYVWRVSSDSLPLGVFSRQEPDESAYGLEDGDYIVMMTDGVIDAFTPDYISDEKSASLREFLGELSFENPRQIAIAILNSAIARAGGRILDDMTVIVFGIFANT